MPKRIDKLIAAQEVLMEYKDKMSSGELYEIDMLYYLLDELSATLIPDYDPDDKEEDSDND